MKTTHNVMVTSAQLIRGAVKRLRMLPDPPKHSVASEIRNDALDSLDAVAEQLTQYAGQDEQTLNSETLGAERLQGDVH
jgi:hypothetical protein